MRSFESRFWSKVEVRGPDECWLWRGARLPRGYGQIRRGGKMVYAHRAAYELANGPVPDGSHVLHSCDNPPCVSPAHLHVGTHADNMREKSERGRARQGRPRKLTMQQAREIRVLAETVGATAISRKYGVARCVVTQIIDGRTYINDFPSVSGSAFAARDEAEASNKQAPSHNQPGRAQPA